MRRFLPLAALLALALPTTASATPSIGGFSARPLDPTGNVTERSYFRHIVGPGEVFTEQLLVTNNNTTPDTLKVYPVDGVTGTTSGAVYTNAGVPLTGAGTWLTIPTPQLIVAPQSSQVVPIEVHVPANATHGDHLAGVAVEDTTHQRTAHGSFAIVEVLRAAVAFELRVAGAATTSMTTGTVALQALPGTLAPSVVVNLTNSGQLLCKPQLSVTLSNPKIGTVTTTRQLDTIVPGNTIAYPLHWMHPLAAGSYQASATTSGCGAPSAHAETVSLPRPLNPATTLPFTQAPARASGIATWIIVLGGVLAIVIAGGGMFGGFVLARRRPGGGGPVELGT